MNKCINFKIMVGIESNIKNIPRNILHLLKNTEGKLLTIIQTT
jgi:hypothetical protein